MKRLNIYYIHRTEYMYICTQIDDLIDQINYHFIKHEKHKKNQIVSTKTRNET